MTNAALTIAGALTALVLVVQAATAAEDNRKSLDFQQFVDRFAGSIKVDVEKLAKDLPKLDAIKLRGSDEFCAEDKSGDQAAGDWRAIARHYACSK